MLRNVGLAWQTASEMILLIWLLGDCKRCVLSGYFYSAGEKCQNEVKLNLEPFKGQIRDLLFFFPLTLGEHR